MQVVATWLAPGRGDGRLWQGRQEWCVGETKPGRRGALQREGKGDGHTPVHIEATDDAPVCPTRWTSGAAGLGCGWVWV